MATKTTTRKQAAKAETAITTGVVQLGANAEAMAALDEAHIKLYASYAFADDDAGGKLKNNATQTMATAVRGYHSRLILNGEKLASLSAMLSSDKADASVKARTAIRTAMHARFIDELPDRKIVGDDAWSAASIAKGSHSALLNRAIELAALLDLRQVPMSSFNEKLRQWSVPFSMLLDKVTTAPRRMEGVSVFLDNKGTMCESKNSKGVNTTKWVKASIAQLKAANTTPAKRAAGKGQGGGDEAAKIIQGMSVDAITTALSPDKMFEMFHRFVTKSSDGPDKFSNYTTKQLNWYSDIVQHYDAMKHRAEENKPATKAA